MRYKIIYKNKFPKNLFSNHSTIICDEDELKYHINKLKNKGIENKDISVMEIKPKVEDEVVTMLNDNGEQLLDIIVNKEEKKVNIKFIDYTKILNLMKESMSFKMELIGLHHTRDILLLSDDNLVKTIENSFELTMRDNNIIIQ